MAIGGLIGQNYNLPAFPQGAAQPGAQGGLGSVASQLYGGMPGGFAGPAEADFGDVSGL